MSGIEVELIRRAGTLQLRYDVTGLIDEMLLPPITGPGRANDLWKHTCFEAFVRSAAEEAYVEYNFAPSTRWAAYRFDGYRRGMRDVEVESTRIATRSTADGYELRALLRLPGNGPWHVGLSAVIEEKNGGKSYWALAHPSGAPDFHHPACFALELPAATLP